jgi:hypothetical protein
MYSLYWKQFMEHLKRTKYCYGTAYSWNEDKKLLQILKEPFYENVFRKSSSVFRLHTLLLWVSLTHIYTTRTSVYHPLQIVAFGSTIFSTTLWTLKEIHGDPNSARDIVCLTNAIILYEQKNCRGKGKFSLDLSRNSI